MRSGARRSGNPLQVEMFPLPAADHPSPGTGAGRPPRSRRAANAAGPSLATIDDEVLVERLKATGRYRILRKLQPRPVLDRPWPEASGNLKIGIVLDTETTGLDHSRDEIIELGMVAFTYDDGGIGDVIGVFSALRAPSIPISPEITKITGITQEMVAGQVIDPDAVVRFIGPAELIIAHNAAFDRPFCERFTKGFDEKPWACSVSEIDWAALGFEGAKLGYLVGQYGWFHNGHRAVDDCHALLEVLASPLRTETGCAFGRLIASVAQTRLRIWAEGSPFHAKDMLKARGYRWNDGSDGRPKCWWTEIEEEHREAELAFLRQEIYRADVDPYVQRLTAAERFRK